MMLAFARGMAIEDVAMMLSFVMWKKELKCIYNISFNSLF